MIVTLSKIKLIFGLVIWVNFMVQSSAGHSETKTGIPSLTEQLINGSDVTVASNSSEARVDYLKSKTKRNPKLSLSMPSFPLPGLFPTPTDSSGVPINTSGSSNLGGSGASGEKLGTATGLGVASTALLIKSGILGGLTAFKAAIIPPLFVGSMVLFLIAGAVYFTCSVFNCGIGPASTNGSPSLTSFFNRNGYDYYDQQVHPVYQSLDEGYKKFQ